MSEQVTRHVESYGEHPLNVGEWFVPDGNGPWPAVVLVHGGFWRPRYDRHLEDPVALDLAAHGYLCWNIDYRSAAEPWPATLLDVAAGYDHLFGSKLADRVDITRIAAVGHSAGGHLAMWLGSRHRLPHGAPGSNPRTLRPALVVPQAGVVALADAARDRLGRSAALQFVGASPDEAPERYDVADPMRLLPTGVRSVLIHGRERIVPLPQARTYVEAARAAGDHSTLELVSGDHFAHLDPSSEACERLRAVLATLG